MECVKLDIKYPLTGQGDRSLNRLHLSDIYSDLENILFPRRGSGSDMNNPLWAEVGFLWERVLGMALKEHIGPRPGEVELDGIVGSPDGYDPATGVLYEYKCTWKSTRNAHPEKVWKWMTQVKGYCKMLGVNTVQFHILYVVGDYRGSGPIYESYLMVFSDREIEENWAMITNHARSKGWIK